MGKWTHPICYGCYGAIYPDREPVRMRNDDTQECCFCSAPTGEGIYIRYDPALLNCQHD